MSIGTITSSGMLTKQSGAKKLFLVRGHCQLRYSTDGYITVDVYFYAAATSSDEINSVAKIGNYIWNHGSYIREGSYVRRKIPCFGGGRSSNSGGEYIKVEYIYMYSASSQPTVYGASTAVNPSYPYPSGVFSIDRTDEV